MTMTNKHGVADEMSDSLTDLSHHGTGCVYLHLHVYIP